MQLEELYDNDEYNQSLVTLAGKNLLPFDEYRQEVFVYLAEYGGDAYRAAKRIAMRMRRANIKQRSVSLDAFSDNIALDHDRILWEERHVLQEV